MSKNGIDHAVVTGSTGFIGRALVPLLSFDDTRVTCLLRPGGRDLTLAPGETNVTLVRPRSFEPEDLSDALAGVRADVVFHLASYGVDPSQRDAAELTAGNATLTARMVAAAAEIGAGRFVFTGSCSEYAPVAEPELLTEDRPLVTTVPPGSPYGVAKTVAEAEGTRVAAELGVPFVPLRLFGCYGPLEAAHRLVPYLVAELWRGRVPSLTGGEQARDLMFVADVARAIVAAGASPGVVPGTPYNVCTGVPVRIREVAQLVARCMGKPEADLGLGRRPYRPDEPMWVVGDPAKFHAATGFLPRREFAEAVSATVSFWVEMAKLLDGPGRLS